MTEVTWVIPLISRDLVYLAGLIEAIKLQTRVPDEVIIVSSGLTASEKNQVNGLIEPVKLQINHVARRLPHTAGQNRNFGASRAHSEYLSFIDADDIPYPSRNEMLVQAIQKEQRDGFSLVILHGFQKIPRDVWNPQDTDLPGDYFQASGHPLEPLTKLTSSRVGEIEAVSMLPARRRPVFGLAFLGANYHPAHGHITLPKTLQKEHKFAWRPFKRGQDVLLANVLVTVPEVRWCFIDRALSVYRNGWSSHGAVDEFNFVHPNPFFRSLIRLRLMLKAKWKRAILISRAFRRF